jgi:predicted ester cyclase
MEATAMTQDEATQAMQHYYDALNTHDLAVVPSIYDERLELDDDAWPELIVGHEGARAFLTSYWTSFPDVIHELVEPPFLASDGKRIAVRVRAFGTHLGLLPPSFAPTGNSFVSEFASFYEIEKGRMLRGRAISNLLKVALQLKLMPELQ